MAKKEIIRRSGIQLICGQAKPGANLAFLKNMALFCKEFNNNEKVKKRMGELVNVEIIVYEDKSYEYNIGVSPKISEAELEKIAQKMMPSLNTDDIEKAKKIVKGTMRSFGNFKITES
nr:5881_t:CDS:2 [Entrophospora candida]